MYYLWQHHNMLPGDFYRMPEGDRELLAAFCMKELEGG